MTVLFCDLVDSTARFHSLGEDEGGRFTRSFLALCGHVVDVHRGRVVKTLGDGVMG